MRPLSARAATVLEALRAGHTYGRQIMRVTGLPGGTVYPILAQLQEHGLVTSRWEDTRVHGRPPRRLYEIIKQAPAGVSAPAGAPVVSKTAAPRRPGTAGRPTQGETTP